MGELDSWSAPSEIFKNKCSINVLYFCLCWSNILTRGFANVFLQEREVTKMDDYEEVVAMLQSIKGNSKALEYLKNFIRDFIKMFC